MGIIYKALNTVNGKGYVGQTIETLDQRKARHYYNALRINAKQVFAKALRKYDMSQWVWEIIDTFNTEDEGNIKETFNIKKYNTHHKDGHGYNMTYGGEFNPFTDEHIKKKLKKDWHKHHGNQWTDEARKKASLSKQGKKLSESAKKAISGDKSVAHREEVKLAKKNWWAELKSDPVKYKLFVMERAAKSAKSRTGKKHNFTEAGKQRLLDAVRNRKISDETRQKLSNRKFSDETRQKLSKSIKANWNKRKSQMENPIASTKLDNCIIEPFVMNN
jgi:hypothetical protein